MNMQTNLNKKTSFEAIKSKKIIELIFGHLDKVKLLNCIKYNKKIRCNI